ncbi:hypothetical protein [Shewanella baltica]|uniref:hypothetical protein n=1 Tax=Shewanella baltica TaxID=62322 RepID=UPI00217E6C97|nr:hypothetical protein [Shewanella baltica]MCS6181124.1 hypothetical protein [Shewanella baltica]
MNTSDWIAFAAILVASLSALYTRWAWREAKKANEISIHSHKKEIYDDFLVLKTHMEQKADFAELQNVREFYRSSRHARLYFCIEIADKLENYYNQCFYIAELNGTEMTTVKRSDLMKKARIAKTLSVEIFTLINKDISLTD